MSQKKLDEEVLEQLLSQAAWKLDNQFHTADDFVRFWKLYKKVTVEPSKSR